MEVSTTPPPPLHLNLQNIQVPPPFLGNSPPLYCFFREPPPPLKIRFSSEPPKYSSFSSLTSSYLLKITKFLKFLSLNSML